VGTDHEWSEFLFAPPTVVRAGVTILRPLKPPARSARAVLLAAALLLTTAGCGVHGLSFVQDERVDIVRPGDRDEVRLPVSIDWTVRNFAVGPDAGSFAVLVDRAPPRSGRPLGWLFRGNDSCKGGAGRALCASAEFLAERGVYATTDTAITLESIARLTGDQRRRQFHEVTVVLLDAQGRRVGEGAWSVEFELKQPL